MPPSTKNHLELREYANSHGTDVSPVNRHDKKLVKSEGRKTGDVQSNALDKRSSPFIYVKYGDWSVVWRNVIIFTILHLLYFYAVYLLLKEGRYKPWLLGWWFALWGGMGITAGAHRLWSHKSYKARLPLRIFLMLGQCIAGQNDLYTWCRDHRVHHKFSETDADPHNSLRGYFFAHMGWLLMKKHPDVMTKGKQVELHDLLADPVIRFQRKFYIPLFLMFAFIFPTALSVYLFNETWKFAFFSAGILRYVTSLHCTWFVNSTAHMFGGRPYNEKINPRENVWVSFGAFGEGYHNYHHTFPWDYATSEFSFGVNVSKLFIDAMAFIGQAYDLKRVPKHYVVDRKHKISAKSEH